MFTLVRLTRTVRVRSEATSLPVAMIRILPSSTRSRPNGAAPKPTSTCRVMVCVMVAAILPVDVGLAVSLYCAMSASNAAWLDEPVKENATVLPLKSSTFRIGELAGTYQYRSGAPIISLPIIRIGAPLAKAPTAADTPAAVAISMLPPINAWIDSGPAWTYRISSSRPCLRKMPARWPSSATPASQAPRCGIATLRTSCAHTETALAHRMTSVHAIVNPLAIVHSLRRQPALRDWSIDTKLGGKPRPRGNPCQKDHPL